MLNKLLDKLDHMELDKIILRLLSAWCLTSVFLLMGTGCAVTSIDKLADISIFFFAGILAGVFAVISLVCFLLTKVKKTDAADKLILPISFGLFSLTTLSSANTYYYAFILVALWAVLIFYYSRKGMLTVNFTMNRKKTILCLAVFGGVFILIAAAIGVIRYKTYSAPNYDFGIFCQMFRNMKESFKPVTTCERDKLLSHFAIHASPIYYILLPFYMLFPKPETLQVCQVVILGSSIIPFALIAKKYGLSDLKTVLLSFAFLFSPAVISGTGYDLHENCFLLPLLLWVFYAYETEKWILLAVFTLLTFCVKEDAAVYIVFFGLYVIFSRRNTRTGVTLILFGVAYFLFVLFMLKTYGNGVMSDRYKNFLSGEGSLFDVIKNVAANPGYVFTQLLIDKEGGYAGKILFLLQMMLPFAFLPFAVKKVSSLILLFPLILLNLMTVYVYQYDIGFQYHFGPLAFVAYLAIINLSTVTGENAKRFVLIAAVASFLLFTISGTAKFSYYTQKLDDTKEDCRLMDEALAQIPEDASVICSTFLLPHLCDRDVLYEDWYHNNEPRELTDYVILDARYDIKEYFDLYSGLGYTTEKEVRNEDKTLMIIMTKDEAK